jgi:uncharacterized protein
MFTRKILSDLQKWADSPNRKPLILRGARQVGKTSAIHLFAKNFKHYLYLNLEKPEDKALFEQNLSVANIIDAICLAKQINSLSGKTLLFIDEIQNSPKAVAILRYFYEEAKHLYVVAAGSLLETLVDKQISFPVGRVEYLLMRPCTFIEFLAATSENKSIELLEKDEFPDFAHEHLLKQFRLYVTIGGMPEVVETYSKTKNLHSLGKIYESLIISYLDDIEKYAKTETMRHVVRHIIRSAFTEAGQRIKFENFGQSAYRSREVGEAFRILEKAFFLELVYPVTNLNLPLLPNIRKSPKLQLIDTGMIAYFAKVQKDMLGNAALDSIFEGKIIEHVVSQELRAMKESLLEQIHFWTKESPTSNAEVDFVYLHEGNVIPIEVKTGTSGRLRSLHQFIDLAPHNLAIRVYSGKFSVENTRTISGKDFTLINLPYYLLNQLPKYIEKYLPESS